MSQNTVKAIMPIHLLKFLNEKVRNFIEKKEPLFEDEWQKVKIPFIQAHEKVQGYKPDCAIKKLNLSESERKDYFALEDIFLIAIKSEPKTVETGENIADVFYSMCSLRKFLNPRDKDICIAFINRAIEN